MATARIRSRGYLGVEGGGEYTFQCVCVCVCARASAHVKKNRLWTYDSRIPCLPLEVGRTPTADETQVPFSSGHMAGETNTRVEDADRGTYRHVRTRWRVTVTSGDGTQLILYY